MKAGSIRLIVLGTALLAVLGLAARHVAVAPIREAASAAAGDGIEVDVHFDGIDLGTYVLDVTVTSASPIDLARVALKTCEAVREASPTASLILAGAGKKRFLLGPEQVSELADATQPPLYRLRLLATRSTPLDGSPPFSDPEGGVLYVVQAVSENATAFAKRWSGNSDADQ